MRIQLKDRAVAYTFDAGPNAVIYSLQQHVAEFLQVVRHVFPPDNNGNKFVTGLQVEPVDISEELKNAIGLHPMPKGISYVIGTTVGPGPRVLEDPSQHLLGEDGLPKKNA